MNLKNEESNTIHKIVTKRKLLDSTYVCTTYCNNRFVLIDNSKYSLTDEEVSCKRCNYIISSITKFITNKPPPCINCITIPICKQKNKYTLRENCSLLRSYTYKGGRNYKINTQRLKMAYEVVRGIAWKK